jgi:hypothetical protein
MPLYIVLHNLLNILVHSANKMELQKNYSFTAVGVKKEMKFTMINAGISSPM